MLLNKLCSTNVLFRQRAEQTGTSQATKIEGLEAKLSAAWRFL